MFILMQAPAAPHVGQIITQAGSNCQLRVKAVKTALFANADLSQYEYCLQFTF